MAHAAFGRENFRAATTDVDSAVRVSRLQPYSQSYCLGRRFLFTLGVNEETTVAPKRVAIAHSLRYSHTRVELFSNAFPLAVSNAVRKRYSVVHALVHGSQLCHSLRWVFRAVLLFPRKNSTG